jgi:hypothetical protein
MTHPDPRSGPPTGGRLAAVIVGGIVTTFAVLVLLAGGGLFWLNEKKDADGYFTTSSQRFEASGYAVTSDDLEVDEGIPAGDDLYGKVRLKATSGTNAPVFVGVARTSDVDAYLAGSGHATLTDLDFSPFRPSYRTTQGDRRPEAPGSRDIWAASAEGAGTQTLTWEVEDGSWSVVVMNADASPGVDARVSAGANLPIVGDIAWGVTIFGVVLLAGGGALLAGGLIRPRRRPSSPAGSALAA